MRADINSNRNEMDNKQYRISDNESNKKAN